MASLSPAEVAYLTEDRRFGRVATVDSSGLPHVVPIGVWRYNPETDTIDVFGRGLAASKKFRNVAANPRAAFVVDDMVSTDPWHPRAVMIQGRAEALQAGLNPLSRIEDAVIRIHTDHVVSWGLKD